MLSDSLVTAEQTRLATREAAQIVSETARQSSQVRLDLADIIATVNATLGRRVDKWMPSFALFSSGYP